MKKLAIFVLMVLFIIGCGTTKKWESLGLPGNMTSVTLKIDKTDIAEICQLDTLPNLIYWGKVQFKDFETRQPITEYAYMKGDSLVYVIIDAPEGITLTKRLIKKQKR